MLNPVLTKNYDAGAAVPAFTIVCFDDADGVVIPAEGGDAAAIGVSTSLAAAAGERVDVIRTGIAEVTYGAVVTRGDFLMANGDGQAIPLVADDGVRSIGIAEVSGAAGDVGSVLLSLAPTNAPADP